MAVLDATAGYACNGRFVCAANCCADGFSDIVPRFFSISCVRRGTIAIHREFPSREARAAAGCAARCHADGVTFRFELPRSTRPRSGWIHIQVYRIRAAAASRGFGPPTHSVGVQQVRRRIWCVSRTLLALRGQGSEARKARGRATTPAATFCFAVEDPEITKGRKNTSDPLVASQHGRFSVAGPRNGSDPCGKASVPPVDGACPLFRGRTEKSSRI